MLGSKIENKKYFGHNKKRFQLIVDELDRLLKNKNKIRILDIGTSPLTFLIRERYPKINLTTLDYSNNFKSRCRREKIEFIKKDLNKPIKGLMENYFDVILFLEVIEHLSSDGSYVLNKIGDLLKPGGYLLVQTPNRFSLKNVVLNIISEKAWDNLSCPPLGGEEFDHFKEYGFDELKLILKKVRNLRLVRSEKPLYFDYPESTLVYRKSKFIFYPIMYLYFLTVYLIPIFRRGMYFKLRKI